MKRIILILITLTSLENVSYGSFPVFDTLNVQQDILQKEEIQQYHYYIQQMGFDVSSCKCISCRNGINPIVLQPKPLPISFENIIEEEKKELATVKKIIKEDKREASGGLYALLSIFSAIGSIFFGLLSLGHAFSNNASYSLVLLFFILSLISVLGSVRLAIKAKKKGVNWALTILAVGIAFLSVLFLFPLFFV